MQNILSGFLTAGLLPIGEDDQKLKLLESAAGDLSDQIKARPLLAYRFVLVGLDDRITITDPALKKAEEAVIGRWNTITNKIGASPVQVFRAVILRALELAGAENSGLNQAIGLIARNEPALHSNGKERVAIVGMLEKFEEAVSDELTETWVNPVKIALPKISGKAKKAQVGKDELATALSRAVGPNDKEGKSISGANPHWPNTGQPWSQEFIGRAADAIHGAIQSASKGFADDMQEAVLETVQELVNGIERLAIRDAKTELLWIRTSMYSPSAHEGYRELKPIDLVFHAVIDMSRAVAMNAPPSVEFFLRDLVAPLAKKKMRLAEVITEIGPKLAALPETSAMFSDTLPAAGRRTWLDVAARPNHEVDFEQQMGVPAVYEENAAELAVKFYRELQIRKLLSTTS